LETRKPPQDIDAEQSVLGGMMLSPDAIADAVEHVRAEDFYRPAHETVFDAVVGLYTTGQPADAVTVAAELARLGQLEKIGGAAYLHELISTVPTAANVGYYAKIVKAKAKRRRGIEACMRGVQALYDNAVDVDEAIAETASGLDAATGLGEQTDYRPVGEIVNATIDEIESIAHRGTDVLAGVPTGFADLDRLTHGLHPGQMIIIAARPAVGKSTLGLDIARAAAIHHGMTTAIFSLEMGATEITMRLLSAEARVPLQNMRKGLMREDDWIRIARVMGEVEEAPLYIDDSPRLTMTDIRAKARRLHRTHGLKLLVVDYLQLMSSGKRVENRQQEVSEFSRALKLLAKELEVPVIALSQLNRGPEQRTDKRPMISDLRESGSLEQDADMVILLHREDMYDKESPRAGEADFIVAKHRNGPTDTVVVAFQGHYSRFVDMAS
jgi:replicative DNA helicase